MILLVLACARGIAEKGDPADTGAGSPGDTDSAPVGETGGPDPADPTCDEAPVVTWDNFGRGFLVENCQACHASTAPDRHGAPIEVVFDTEGDARAWKDRILARAAGEAPTMPPMGGTSADDRYLLGVWLTCWLDYWDTGAAR